MMPAGRPGGGAYTSFGRGVVGLSALKPAGSAFSRKVSRHCDSSRDFGMLAGASLRPPPFLFHNPRMSGVPSDNRLMGPAYFEFGVGMSSNAGFDAGATVWDVCAPGAVVTVVVAEP